MCAREARKHNTIFYFLNRTNTRSPFVSLSKHVEKSTASAANTVEEEHRVIYLRPAELSFSPTKLLKAMYIQNEAYRRVMLSVHLFPFFIARVVGSCSRVLIAIIFIYTDLPFFSTYLYAW
jgi:hypothetical protein